MDFKLSFFRLHESEYGQILALILV